MIKMKLLVYLILNKCNNHINNKKKYKLINLNNKILKVINFKYFQIIIKKEISKAEI